MWLWQVMVAAGWFNQHQGCDLAFAFAEPAIETADAVWQFHTAWGKFRGAEPGEAI